MTCKTCGLELKNFPICPFCGNDKDYDSLEDFSNLFTEEKVKIDFNMKNILNDVDFRNEYENISVKEADISKQYLEMDLNAVNIDKINIINDYYVKSIEIFKKKQKKNLELFDIQMLQSHVASFNEIVNNCNKFKKMVPDQKIKNNLDKTIKLYNTEIHYIKKYFILPLYDTPGLLNRSKIVKLVLDVFSIALIYSILYFTGLINLIGRGIHYFTEHWSAVTELQKSLSFNFCVSTLGSIYISEIFFQLFLNLTIKNKNFQVDKNKKYEIHIAVALVGFVLSCLHTYLFYGYIAGFFTYTGYKTVKCILVDKWNIESIIEKAAIVLCLIYLIVQFCINMF